MNTRTNAQTESLISIQNLCKSYGDKKVLDGIDLHIKKGRIVGLIGPNGAGKTTALKCLLGLSTYNGEINVMGLNPLKQRRRLLEEVCFIADTAILPQWLKVSQALEYLQGIHPKFDLAKANRFLSKTSINRKQKISQLSKGMITQLHLALVMAIDAKVLVLDEPTLGLDILYRKQFYSTLLNDYFDEDRTIIITTHQVEEIEGLLTDLLFIRDGKIILNREMEDLEDHFFEVEVRSDKIEIARSLNPIGERSVLGGAAFIFEDTEKQGDFIETLEDLGSLSTPSIADIFVAKMQNQ
ncbi:MAG: ABC-2 type transport system ATP-binding protein [Gammaproteobacteria bacterium]|jgi:ABC-2 type transport system ATP-binding protein